MAGYFLLTLDLNNMLSISRTKGNPALSFAVYDSFHMFEDGASTKAISQVLLMRPIDD